MARYIKANPKVASYLHLENDRLKLKDGNYILWQGDMTAFGPLPMLNETLTQIGGIALMPHEAKQEQDGTYNRPLPVATDERFIMDEATDPEPQTDDEAEAVTDENGEGQAPAAASTEEPTDDEGDGDTDEEPAEAEAEAENESETTESDNPETE